MTNEIQKPELQSGETYIGAITSAAGVTTHLILLPGETSGNWKKCMEWAGSLGGDLPSRVEQALLFADFKDQFQDDWYWSNTEFSTASAWYQDFYYGNQSTYHKVSSYCRARAVRRLIIQ